jgi:nucleoside-diphosphate-sugar epimerase
MSGVTSTVVLGCGYLGAAVVRRLRADDPGGALVVTTRSAEHARVLRDATPGVRVHESAALAAEAVAAVVPEGSAVLVAFPPDGVTDARIAPALRHARAVVYVSTTGVYGEARGRVSEETPTDARSPKARARLAAEECYRAHGAVVLRPAGIYGPGRGLHLRLARGDFRLPGDGAHVVSRIHVEDLAALCVAALRRGPRGAVYVAADAAPVAQIEAVRWLCARLGCALPPSVPVSEAPETLRHDRSVDGARGRRELGVALRYPSYREGFAHCIARDLPHLAPAG